MSVSAVTVRRLFLSAVVLGVLVGAIGILIWLLYPASPPTGAAEANKILAAARDDILVAVGPAWRPVQERDEPCEDSTPPVMYLDLRGSAATPDEVIAARLRARGWRSQQAELVKHFRHADVSATVQPIGRVGATVTVVVGGNPEGYCGVLDSPPRTFTPTPP